MVLYKDWKKFLAGICKQKGYINGKNCTIKYEAHVLTDKDIIEYKARILPTASIEEIELTITID